MKLRKNIQANVFVWIRNHPYHCRDTFLRQRIHDFGKVSRFCRLHPISPGKSSHPRPSFFTVIGDRVESAGLVTRNPNDRLLQTQFAQDPRRNWLAAFIGKQAKNAIAPAMCRLERLLRMSGEMLAVFLFIARDCHLIATWQNADISKLAICSLPFLHSGTLPPS